MPGLVIIPRKQPGLVFKGMMAIVIAMVVFFSGTGLTVFASQNSLPNQSLYQLKLISEDVIISLAGSPQIQIAHSLNFADRRLEEISALMNRGETIPEFIVDRMQNELNLAITLAASLGDHQMLQELDQIHLRIQTQLQTVNTLMENSTTGSPSCYKSEPAYRNNCVFANWARPPSRFAYANPTTPAATQWMGSHNHPNNAKTADTPVDWYKSMELERYPM